MAKKNLLVITNSFPDRDDRHIGGIFVKEQVRHIAPHFDKVTVVFPSAFGASFDPPEDYADYRFDNVDVVFLKYANVPLFLHVLRVGFTYLMARAVKKMLRRRRTEYDIIHAHFTWPSGAAAARIKEGTDVPLVVTEHTSLTLKKAVAAEDPQYVDTWMACDAVIRNREGDMGMFTSVGVPEERLHYIPNGFDSWKFRPMDKGKSRDVLGLPRGKRIIVSIGGLDEVKGHAHLIDAVAPLMAADQDIVCYILGEGPLRESLSKRIKEKGLQDRIKLVGERPHAEMPGWINSSDVVVHPSLSESGPMVMFEALGCGRPFVGTRVGAVPSVVTSDDLGLVSEPGDVPSLRSNIERALSREWDEKKLVDHSKQYASEWVSRELLDLYDRLLSEG